MFAKYILSVINHIIPALQQIIVPYTCIFCRQITHTKQDLCAACAADLPPLITPCPRCATPQNHHTLPHLACAMCLNNPPYFNRSYCLFTYDQPLPIVLARLRWQRCLIYAQVFGTMLGNNLSRIWDQLQPQPEIIIPMPMAKSALQACGYNPAMEIARPLSKILALPLVTNFAHTANRNVALVHDVLSVTGICNIVSQELKRTGAKHIDLWCVARY